MEKKLIFTAYSNDGRKDPWFKVAYCNDNGDSPYLGMRYNRYPASGFERLPSIFIVCVKGVMEKLAASNPDRFEFNKTNFISHARDYLDAAVDEVDVSTSVEVGSLKYWRDVVVLKDRGPFTVIWGDCEKNHSELYGSKRLGLYWNDGKAKVTAEDRFFLLPDFYVVPSLMALVTMNRDFQGFCVADKTEAVLKDCLSIYNSLEKVN